MFVYFHLSLKTEVVFHSFIPLRATVKSFAPMCFALSWSYQAEGRVLLGPAQLRGEIDLTSLKARDSVLLPSQSETMFIWVNSSRRQSKIFPIAFAFCSNRMPLAGWLPKIQTSWSFCLLCLAVKICYQYEWTVTFCYLKVNSKLIPDYCYLKFSGCRKFEISVV